MLGGKLIVLYHKSEICTFSYLSETYPDFYHRPLLQIWPPLTGDVVMGIYKKKWEWPMEVEKGRQSERKPGESLTTERKEQMQKKDGHVREKCRLGGKIKHKWRSGCCRQSGQSSVNNYSQTTLTWCGQQLFSCCFCLICFPPQYVWYACHKCSTLVSHLSCQLLSGIIVWGYKIWDFD